MQPKVVNLFNLKPLVTKFFLLFLLSTFYFLLSTGSVFAQTASSSAIPTSNYQLQTTNFSPQSPHSASLAIHNFSHAMSCILIGQSSIAPCLEYKPYKDATGVVKSIPVLSSANTSNGLFGFTLSMVGEVIGTKPVSSSVFIADLGEQIGIKSANAQVGGSGSGVLTPVFKLWEVSRNISYLVMILIFVLVGLMVMFRQKLNPQTVVSIQMALPGLVIGLIMITFSYFLASLIADVAFIGTNVVGYYFSLAQGSSTPTQLPLTTTTHWMAPVPGSRVIPTFGATETREANVLTIFGRFTSILPSDQIKGAIDSIWVYLDDPDKSVLNPTNIQLDAAEALLNVSRFTIYQFFAPLNTLVPGWGAITAALIGIGVGSLSPTGTISFGLGFVATLILIYSMFRLLYKLLQNFLAIIFLTIASPFYFLAASLPGRQSLGTTWMFNMLCNVLAFPAVFGVFYFAAFMLGTSNPEPLFQTSAGGDVIGSSTFPLLGGLTHDFLNRLLAFGALVATPSIPDIICRAVGKPGQLGGLAAGAIGGAISQGQRYSGQTSSGFANLAGSPGRLTDAAGYQYNAGTREWRENPFGYQAGLRTRVALNPFGRWLGQTGLGQSVVRTRLGNRLFNVKKGVGEAGHSADAAHATHTSQEPP